ncbi:MAG: GNAT family N-acetyltransferase, partial [Actinomycetota bacterium]|nr:GNAT family N-acetyltransferase [Actinomycetota bacterium]
PELQVGNPAWATRDELESEVADWKPPPEETLFVGDQNAAVVAFGGVELPSGFEHAELFGPLVATEARGQRFGARLLDASIARAHDANVAFVLASLGTRNAAGRILLLRRGFRPRGRPQATFRLRAVEHRAIQQPPDGVDVRPATEDDLAPALALYHECFPGGLFPDSAWRENVGNGTVYAAEHDHRLVAVLNIDPRDRWIYHVGVTASERNRGVGAYLLSRALEDYWARHPGDTLGLEVAADNIAAIRLYRRQGFAPWLVLQAFELAL